MLKRNLFAIIFAGLVLVFTNNAFGQWHPEIDKIKSPRDVATGQIKSPGDSASGQATNRDTRTRGLIDTSTGEIVWVKEGKSNTQKVPSSIKSPRDVATGQVSNYNLGDTATHERKKT